MWIVTQAMKVLLPSFTTTTINISRIFSFKSAVLTYTSIFLLLGWQCQQRSMPNRVSITAFHGRRHTLFKSLKASNPQSPVVFSVAVPWVSSSEHYKPLRHGSSTVSSANLCPTESEGRRFVHGTVHRRAPGRVLCRYKDSAYAIFFTTVLSILNLRRFPISQTTCTN